ncbi:GNAT family N-acetyltransferase [Bacillota bacterium LX-D]|nr:GNAT family N-acetyltransferase [Bacillota bacterium LX-D]
MALEIHPVQRARDFNLFWQLEKNLYSPAERSKLPPLEITKKKLNPRFNQFLQHISWQCYLAFLNNKVIGRIIASHDHYLADQSIGFFGLWEVDNNFEAAQGLLKAAENWLQKQGKKQIVGPVTLSTADNLGLLVEGFEQQNPFFLSYNHPYYQDLLEKAGYRKLHDLYAYHWSSSQQISPRLHKISLRLQKSKQVIIRPIRFNKLREEAEKFLSIYNSAMVENWGYTPLTLGEVSHILHDFRKRFKPEFCLFAEVKEAPAGLCLAVPDQNNGTKRAVRLAILAVSPEFNHLGLSALLVTEMISYVKKKGFQQAELSFIQEGNQVVNKLIQEDVGSSIIKRYRLYTKELST